MSDIFNLLSINTSSFANFALQAFLIDDHQTKKIFNRNISKLEKIENNSLDNGGIKASVHSIDAVINKVVRCAKENDSSLDSWSIQELRILSYYLIKLRGDIETFIFALNILDKAWRNMFINGIVFLLMDCWNKIEEEYKKPTCDLIQKKLNEYNENNSRYLLLKNHGNFFESFGPMRMATLVSTKQMNIFDAPTIIGYRSSTIGQSYYSDVILNYVEKHNVRDINYIEKILECHKLDRTKKLLFAYLVESENKNGDADRRIQLCRFINRELGDISIATTWAPFAGASYEEAQRLKHAMNTVNIWFAQQIVETFFELCVQDKDRKTFWLKYVNQIDGFRIVGSAATKIRLQSNSRIGGMFFRYFLETNSTKSETSALVLFMKDKMMVEFSDTGALYVYNQNHRMVKLVTGISRNISSTADLKIPSIQMLVYKDKWSYFNLYDEGRLDHRGNWQERLTVWIQNKILNSNAKCTVFSNNRKDDIFQAKPITDETKSTAFSNKKSRELPQVKPQKEGSKSTDITDLQHVQRTIFHKKEETKEYVLPISSGKNIDDVIYEKKVNIILKSKVFFDDLEVVGNSKGFYLTTTSRNKYTFLEYLKVGTYPVGSIWIKKHKMDGWCKIVHFYNGEELDICFIRKTNKSIYYKRSMQEGKKKEIKLG